MFSVWGSVWLMLYKSVRADPLHRDLDYFTDVLVESGEQVLGEVDRPHAVLNLYEPDRFTRQDDAEEDPTTVPAQ